MHLCWAKRRGLKSQWNIRLIAGSPARTCWFCTCICLIANRTTELHTDRVAVHMGPVTFPACVSAKRRLGCSVGRYCVPSYEKHFADQFDFLIYYIAILLICYIPKTPEVGSLPGSKPPI